MTTPTSLAALLALSQSQEDSPNTRHLNYTKHIHQVEFVNNVYDGIDSVIAAEYLFKFPQETTDTYNTRADRATLRNFVKRAVEAFTGMIFRKSIEVEGYGARTTRSFAKIDTHQDIQSFTKDMTTAATKDGKTYILIDSPSDGSSAPYLVHIERSQLINWRSDVNGKFTMIVIEEVVATPVGKFGTAYKTQWRHYDDTGAITIYQEVDKEIVLIETIQSDYIGIPLVEVVVDDIPILYDTAKLNIKHFNRLSHKDRYLTMAALPIPVIWGADIGDDGAVTSAKPALVIGVDEAFIFTGTKQECDFEWRELDGSSIVELEKDLDSITEDITTGILRAADSANAVQKTATEVALLQAEASDRVSAIAIAVESGMRDALIILAQFNNESVPETAKFIISKDFSSALAGTDGQRIVFESYLQGLVSIETYLQSLSDAELISIESTTKEIAKIKADNFVPVPKTNDTTGMDNRTVNAINAE
tara:strand:- start:17717 stop:19147 length:1431 start_codon:yes stop_codon:yes gene_type:complete